MNSQPIELSVVVGELARYRASNNPTKRALLLLYEAGEIWPAAIRDGQIVWRATNQNS